MNIAVGGPWLARLCVLSSLACFWLGSGLASGPDVNVCLLVLFGCVFSFAGIKSLVNTVRTSKE